MFLKGCQSLLGLTNYLRFVVVCYILGSRKFCKYLKRVAVQKSLRTPALRRISVFKLTFSYQSILIYLWKVHSSHDRHDMNLSNQIINFISFYWTDSTGLANAIMNIFYKLYLKVEYRGNFRWCWAQHKSGGKVFLF
jgi:hypothetical protein